MDIGYVKIQTHMYGRLCNYSQHQVEAPGIAPSSVVKHVTCMLVEIKMVVLVMLAMTAS